MRRARRRPAGSDGPRRVAVWRWDWLPASETFIRRQCDSLVRFDAVPLGAVRLDSPLVRDSDRIVFRSVLQRRVLARLFRYASVGRSVRRCLLAERVALVHAHFGTDAALVVRTAKALAVPLVVTLHGRDITSEPMARGWRGAQYRRRLRHVFRYASTVIAVSEAIAERAVELGAPADRVVVHYMGIEIRPVLARDEARWDVLFVGRLVEKKGVDDLVRALAVLRRQGRDVRACVVGQGPLMPALTSLAAELGVEVTFAGHRSPADVTQMMSASTVLALPSKTARDGDMEGLPTVAMEALAAGIPVAATHHSGIPEIIRHGESGLLSDEGDPEGLARNIGRLLDDPALRERLRRGGRRTVEQRFDLGVQSRALEDLFDRVLHESERPRLP